MQRDEEDAGIDAAVTERIRPILSEVEESDFQLVDPPADLWERIEASLKSDATTMSPKVPPARQLPARTIVEYRIDANDVVIEFGRDWADFARGNDAPDLAVPGADRSLWSYFDDDEIRDLWRLLVERVRASQRAAELPLRCDAPHARRWFELTITPEPSGDVHFRCVSMFEEARTPVSLLDPHSERDDGLEPVPLCSWCGQGQHGSEWLDIEDFVRATRLLEQDSMPPISYGICESCRGEMSAELLVPGGLGESKSS